RDVGADRERRARRLEVAEPAGRVAAARDGALRRRLLVVHHDGGRLVVERQDARQLEDARLLHGVERVEEERDLAFGEDAADEALGRGAALPDERGQTVREQAVAVAVVVLGQPESRAAADADAAALVESRLVEAG